MGEMSIRQTPTSGLEDGLGTDGPVAASRGTSALGRERISRNIASAPIAIPHRAAMIHGSFMSCLRFEETSLVRLWMRVCEIQYRTGLIAHSPTSIHIGKNRA